MSCRYEFLVGSHVIMCMLLASCCIAVLTSHQPDKFLLDIPCVSRLEVFRALPKSYYNHLNSISVSIFTLFILLSQEIELGLEVHLQTVFFT